MTDEKIMREQFECLMDDQDDPRFVALRDVLMRPFEEHAPAPARAAATGG